MIIALCLGSGDLSILCICPEITKEALQRIKQEATFRVNFNMPGREDTTVARANIPADIQNFDVRIRLPPCRDFCLEDAFRFSSIRHLSNRDDGTMGRCTVTIEAQTGALDHKKEHVAGNYRGPPVLWALYSAMSDYKHFKTLIIKTVKASRDTLYWSSSPHGRLCMDALDAHALRKALVFALGPAKFIKDNGKGYLEFRPRQYNESKAKGMKQS